MQQDIHEKENKTSDLNHCLEILSEGSELKLNGINNQITSIHTSLNNITSSHKANNDCSRISSSQEIDEVKFFRNELGNKIIIVNILLENIFSSIKQFCSYNKLKDNYTINAAKKQFETPKRYSGIKLRKMKQLQLTTDIKFSLPLMKMMQMDTIMIMTNYLIMSRQAYNHK